LRIQLHSVFRKSGNSFAELPSFHRNFSKPHQISVQNFSALFLCQIEALFPLSPISEHLKPSDIALRDELSGLAAVDQMAPVLLTDVVHEPIMQVLIFNLRDAIFCLIVVSALNIRLHGLLIEPDVFQVLSGRFEPFNLLESFGNDPDHVLAPLLVELQRQMHGPLPGLLQNVRILEVLLFDFQVCLDGPLILPGLLPELRGLQKLLAAHVRAALVDVLVLNFVDQMRRVFFRDPQRLREVSLIRVHFNRQFRFFRVHKAIFRLHVVPLIDEEPGLIQQQRRHVLRVVLPGDLQRRVEIAHVLVHLHGLRGLAGLDEVVLGLFVPFFVLQKEGVFQVNVLDFVLRVLIGHFEGLVELVSVAQVLDNRVDQVHPQQHLHSVFLAERLGPLLRELAGLLVRAVQLAAPHGVLPLPVRLEHLHGAVPRAGLDVMMLGQLVVALSFELLRDVC
jgi:hypothetical protein